MSTCADDCEGDPDAGRNYENAEVKYLPRENTGNARGTSATNGTKGRKMTRRREHKGDLAVEPDDCWRRNNRTVPASSAGYAGSLKKS